MTQPNFRALAQELVDAYVWCIKKYIHNIPEQDTLVLRARTALATPPPEPPTEQKSSIDELIAGCKPLDPEMAEALTTDARWRLFGEDDSATPPPELLRPIPVSERLPKADDINEGGEVWVGEPGRIFQLKDEIEWAPHRFTLRCLDQYDAKNGCTWLPYNALPLPEVAQ